jgi:hypothetical protein
MIDPRISGVAAQRTDLSFIWQGGYYEIRILLLADVSALARRFNL